ncbi:cytochrome b/b6 domain-containing protein [Propionivibrio sp.]|uniref:cytochrome b/b6 domain-containing protein n=1 Tax=Propionivibrio sp. TaxID=2212460 RepID=UPI003BF3E937
MDVKRIKLWDLPTRLFHWLLVIFIAAAIISGNIGGGAIDWHGRIGLVILGLLAFRIVWGVIGSSHARFASFFPTPASVLAYLRGQWHGVGHNPLGAFSVFGLLALIGLQLGTGLFGNDDIAFRGPLFDLISKELSDKLTGIHKFSVNALIALIVLHLGAITFYAHVKKDNLVKPMITGWKDVKLGDGVQGESAKGGGALAFIVALLIALAVVYGGSGAWIPAPPTPVAAPPAW